MKIIGSISSLYQDQLPLIEKLKKDVDALIVSIKSNKWHYESRIKALESFTLKIETGRFSDPKALEDFFGCLLVVENKREITKAISTLKKHFKIIYKRPKDPKTTHKSSDSFVFDDLRVYVTRKPTSAREKGPINDVVFEIQVKTFLQHAWSIATHDLIYKSDDINWTKQRVAYQVRAMLENAEISIEKAASVRKIRGLPETNEKVFYQNEVKRFLLRNWSSEKLPADIVRLVDNTVNLLSSFRINLEEMQQILDKETNQGRGINTINLSPYLILLQSVINVEPEKVGKFLSRKSSKRLFLPSEVDISNLGPYVSK